MLQDSSRIEEAKSCRKAHYFGRGRSATRISSEASPRRSSTAGTSRGEKRFAGDGVGRFVGPQRYCMA